jgi:hypothetical protein
MFTEITTEKEMGQEPGHLSPSGVCMSSWHALTFIPTTQDIKMISTCHQQI